MDLVVSVERELYKVPSNFDNPADWIDATQRVVKDYKRLRADTILALEEHANAILSQEGLTLSNRLIHNCQKDVEKIQESVTKLRDLGKKYLSYYWTDVSYTTSQTGRAGGTLLGAIASLVFFSLPLSSEDRELFLKIAAISWFCATLFSYGISYTNSSLALKERTEHAFESLGESEKILWIMKTALEACDAHKKRRKHHIRHVRQQIELMRRQQGSSSDEEQMTTTRVMIDGSKQLYA